MQASESVQALISMSISRQPKRLMTLQKQSGTLLAGLMLGALVAVDSLSYASLIYGGALHPHLLYGVSAALLGSGLLLIIVAFFSSSKLTIAAPQDVFAAIAALVCLSLVNTLQHIDARINPLPTILSATAIMVFLMGLSMYLLGVMKWGKLVRYIPYPVIGGFLAGTGWLILISTLGSMTQTYSAWDTGRQLLTSEHYLTWLIPFAFGLLILVVVRIMTRNQVFPVMIISGFLFFYVYLWLKGISVDEARGAGWMMGPFPEGNLPLLPNVAMIHGVQWSLLGQHMADYFAVTILGIISMLLNVSSFEMSSKETMDVNHELKYTGMANVLVAVLGGLGGYQVLSFSKTNLNFAINKRAVGILAGLFCLLLIFVGTALLTYLPKFMFSALLIYVALEFLVEWLVSIKQKISWLDYTIVVAIVTCIIVFGLLVGIIIGLLLSLAIFFFRYSRIPVISSVLSGEILHSNVERNQRDKYLLAKFGKNRLIINVRGYLFFGNVYEMTQVIIELLDKELSFDRQVSPHHSQYYLIINFSQVTGIEISGTISFINLLNRASQRQVDVLFTRLPANIEEEIRHFAETEHNQLIYRHFSDLDHALEWCENALLSDHPGGHEEDMTHLFHMAFPTIAHAEELLAYAKKTVFKKGEVVCYEGEQSTDLFWVAEGVLEVTSTWGGSGEKRLREIQAGAMVGEIAFYLDQPRSASVIAANDTVTYRFTAESLDKLSKEKPLLAAAFHKNMVSVIAKRLVYANRLLSSNYPIE